MPAIAATQIRAAQPSDHISSAPGQLRCLRNKQKAARQKEECSPRLLSGKSSLPSSTVPLHFLSRIGNNPLAGFFHPRKIILILSIPRSSGQHLNQARAVVLPLPNFHRAVIFAKTLYLGVAIHGLFMIGQKMVKKEWLHGRAGDGENEKILPLVYYLISCSAIRCKPCKYSFISVALAWLQCGKDGIGQEPGNP